MPRCCVFQLSWSLFSLFFTTKSMYSHTRNDYLKAPFPHMSPSIHKQIITQSFSNIPLCSNIQQSTFPHQPKAGGPPFLSRTGNLRAPAPINSNSFFEIAFFPRCLYLHQKMYIYYFMLYLAESLTGRNYTEGKLLRYFPLWRERGNDDNSLSSLAVSP